MTVPQYAPTITQNVPANSYDLPVCHLEQAKRIEGSSHWMDCKCFCSAQILRLPTVAQDDMAVTFYEFADTFLDTVAVYCGTAVAVPYIG